MIQLLRYFHSTSLICSSLFFFLAVLPVSVFCSSNERIGVFIGCDYGLKNEKPLKYASRDAEQLAKLMRQSGGFSQDRCYLLTNNTLEEITSTFNEVAGRLKEIKRTGEESCLFLYYSGHGSADALHINGKKFKRKDFRELFEKLDSDLKIVIIDACESGDFLRQKGARLVENHTIALEGKVENKGTMVISSSARGEMAQESQEYRGAVFTHHLLNGLRGMADYNGDEQVALMEVFHYAGVATRMEKFRGQKIQQHPSYDFDVVGKSDVVLTDLRTIRSKLLLHAIPAQYIEIYDSYNLELAGRAYIAGDDLVYCHLPSQKYVVTFSQGDDTYIRHVDLTWGKSEQVTGGDFSRKPNLLLYTKGGSRNLQIDFHGIQSTVRSSQPVFTKRAPFYLLGYVFRKGSLKQELSFGYAGFLVEGSGVPLQNELSMFRGAYACKISLLRFVYGQLLAGGEVSFHRVHQSVRDLRVQDTPLFSDGVELEKVQSSATNIYQLYLPLELELFAPRGIWIGLSAGVSVFRYYESNRSTPQYKTSFEPGFSLGYQF